MFFLISVSLILVELLIIDQLLTTLVRFLTTIFSTPNALVELAKFGDQLDRNTVHCAIVVWLDSIIMLVILKI